MSDQFVYLNDTGRIKNCILLIALLKCLKLNTFLLVDSNVEALMHKKQRILYKIELFSIYIF